MRELIKKTLIEIRNQQLQEQNQFNPQAEVVKILTQNGFKLMASTTDIYEKTILNKGRIAIDLHDEGGFPRFFLYVEKPNNELISKLHLQKSKDEWYTDTNTGAGKGWLLYDNLSFTYEDFKKSVGFTKIQEIIRVR